MRSAHFEPAARARRHRRRLFGSDDDDDDNETGIRVLGGGGKLVPSVTTIVDTIPLIGTTLLHTHVGTVLVPAPDTTSISPTPASSSVPLRSSTQTQATSLNASSSSTASETPSSSSTSTSQTSASPSPSTNLSESTSASQVVASSAQADNASRSIHTVSSTVTASPTAGAGASTVGATSNNKSLSGGAIGAIVAVSIIVGLALMVFLVRKLFLRKRQNRRDTWGAGVFPKGDFGDHHGQDVFEKPPLSPPPIPEKPITPTSAFPMLAPPPTSYNNTPAPSMSPTLQPAAGSPAVALSPAGAGSMFAYVRCTFIPTLPDELSIAMGESVRILNEYDDGWALCINNRNEQGVVPLECLDRSSAPTKPGHYLGQGTGDWRMSRRASSLYAAQGPMRY